MDWVPFATAPQVRVVDAERRAAVDLLRQHTAAGRIDLDEFSERAYAVFAATTAGEIDRVFSDLPVVLVPVVATRGSTPRWAWHPSIPTATLVAGSRYVGMALLLVALWAATGIHHPFWPAWFIVFGGLGAIRHAGGRAGWPAFPDGAVSSPVGAELWPRHRCRHGSPHHEWRRRGWH